MRIEGNPQNSQKLKRAKISCWSVTASSSRHSQVHCQVHTSTLARHTHGMPHARCATCSACYTLGVPHARFSRENFTVDLGPVHTTPDKFKNATLFLRLGLPSTLIRINCPPKIIILLLKTFFKVDKFETAGFAF